MTEPNPSREDLIAMYAAGYEAVTAALAGITEAELDTAEAPGEWTPRQVAHHLGDSEMIAAGGLRTMAAHDTPLISGYDHELLAERLWRGMPIADSLEAFRGARVATLPLLRSFTEADWAREAVDPDGERWTIHDWLTWYGPHAHGHADQIRRARAVWATGAATAGAAATSD